MINQRPRVLRSARLDTHSLLGGASADGTWLVDIYVAAAHNISVNKQGGIRHASSASAPGMHASSALAHVHDSFAAHSPSSALDKIYIRLALYVDACTLCMRDRTQALGSGKQAVGSSEQQHACIYIYISMVEAACMYVSAGRVLLAPIYMVVYWHSSGQLLGSWLMHCQSVRQHITMEYASGIWVRLTDEGGWQTRIPTNESNVAWALRIVRAAIRSATTSICAR